MIKGLTQDTRVIANVPFPVSDYFKEYKNGTRPHPFCEGILKDVRLDVRVAEKYILEEGVTLEGDEKPTPEQVTPESRRYILVFEFTDNTNTYTHYEELWDNDGKTEWKNIRIYSQIMTAFTNLEIAHKLLELNPNNKETGLFKVDENADKSYKNYFTAIAKQFNEGRGGTPVYKKDGNSIPVRFKLVRQGVGKNSNNLQLSVNGNCIERMSNNPNIKSILSVQATGKNPDKFEIIEATPKGTPMQTAPPIGGSMGGDQGWPEDL
jgi:hypothetical protein